ncbi:uncharacterized protein I303_107548 [Kwoniella dejecticola CBS 10117]|uniref:Uncharacterized protein n=1 Tax=Kwoniella dejecticola CBS 10117 TaxID=1296121 RepID=A0A1A5ZV17_9TREE|nr:uncharacterized protein I303_07558 [Kwoniella dejecticola CBS 10117]OBR81648.1 hypothetical protein I303_07558 [Kwoniella dejecticola CBS 10117]
MPSSEPLGTLPFHPTTDDDFAAKRKSAITPTPPLPPTKKGKTLSEQKVPPLTVDGISSRRGSSSAHADSKPKPSTASNSHSHRSLADQAGDFSKRASRSRDEFSPGSFERDFPVQHDHAKLKRDYASEKYDESVKTANTLRIKITRLEAKLVKFKDLERRVLQLETDNDELRSQLSPAVIKNRQDEEEGGDQLERDNPELVEGTNNNVEEVNEDQALIDFLAEHGDILPFTPEAADHSDESDSGSRQDGTSPEYGKRAYTDLTADAPEQTNIAEDEDSDVEAQFRHYTLPHDTETPSPPHSSPRRDEDDVAYDLNSIRDRSPSPQVIDLVTPDISETTPSPSPSDESEQNTSSSDESHHRPDKDTIVFSLHSSYPEGRFPVPDVLNNILPEKIEPLADHPINLIRATGHSERWLKLLVKRYGCVLSEKFMRNIVRVSYTDLDPDARAGSRNLAQHWREVRTMFMMFGLSEGVRQGADAKLVEELAERVAVRIKSYESAGRTHVKWCAENQRKAWDFWLREYPV